MHVSVLPHQNVGYVTSVPTPALHSNTSTKTGSFFIHYVSEDVMMDLQCEHYFQKQ